jgi:hypothetical protein
MVFWSAACEAMPTLIGWLLVYPGLSVRDDFDAGGGARAECFGGQKITARSPDGMPNVNLPHISSQLQSCEGVIIKMISGW